MANGLVVGRASYEGVYCGDGTNIEHRLQHDYETGYTGPQELQRSGLAVGCPGAAAAD